MTAGSHAVLATQPQVSTKIFDMLMLICILLSCVSLVLYDPGEARQTTNPLYANPRASFFAAVGVPFVSARSVSALPTGGCSSCPFALAPAARIRAPGWLEAPSAPCRSVSPSKLRQILHKLLGRLGRLRQNGKAGKVAAKWARD